MIISRTVCWIWLIRPIATWNPATLICTESTMTRYLSGADIFARIRTIAMRTKYPFAAIVTVTVVDLRGGAVVAIGRGWFGGSSARLSWWSSRARVSECRSPHSRWSAESAARPSPPPPPPRSIAVGMQARRSHAELAVSLFVHFANLFGVAHLLQKVPSLQMHHLVGLAYRLLRLRPGLLLYKSALRLLLLLL